ncbi:putative lipoprotein [Pseudomonas synxantha BG33R]|uniref:Lipoprotein n=1 Tax=Pseudomonas synxantha TaxID=47883 RepID=A0A5D3G472_9PSED|nr:MULTISPECIES: hypothetical protein [Pseudomonas]EIK72119.1 putative lipoprotein [Pseudomonas synxantha BG33R]MBY8971416.1 hypothetical protein [Pseudomonas sp. P867]MCK3823965.1 hypothetical protein [Pseudomonas sp. W2Aug9]MCK3829413.1 hypothetical protein [Pseudomonas fluorescens]MCK3854022.1 hypothetical protein [Pseudomonas sp. W2Jun17]
MTYIRLLLTTLLAVLLLTGCSTIAQSRWEGRDMQEALDLFGKPDSMKKELGSNGEPLAVLTWYKSASWTTTEAAGTSMTHTGNGMVYTEHYQQVGHSSDCKLQAKINQQKKIAQFLIEDGRILHGKCTNVRYVPGYIPPGM